MGRNSKSCASKESEVDTQFIFFFWKPSHFTFHWMCIPTYFLEVRIDTVARNFVRNLARNVVRNVARNVVRNVARKVARNVARNLARNVARNLVRKVARNVARNLAWNVARNVARNVLKLLRARPRQRGEALSLKTSEAVRGD